jgi:hypothetical protein
MRILVYLMLMVSAAQSAELTRQKFLLSFPEISFDEKKVYFSNDEWSAVFAGEMGAMFTVPRDSIEIPVTRFDGRNCQVIIGNATYSCSPIKGNTIVKQDAFGNTDKTITPPNDQALRAFADAWKVPTVSHAEVTEELGPLTEQGSKVWFGLIAFYRQAQAPIPGLGWYDTRTDQFGRVYAASLKNYLPRWIGVRQDTVWTYCVPTGADVGGKLLSYAIKSGTIGEVDPRGYGVPGDTLLNVGMWRGNLLLATENAIAIWHPGEMPWVWQTDAYASRTGTWLKFLTFDIASGVKNVGKDFFPLQKNKPAQAFAKVGDWIELLAPQGVEAAMPLSRWNKRKSGFTAIDWGCGNQLCFERVKIDVSGELREMDLLDAPLAPLEEQGSTKKVGMRAGWVPANDVVPVLMKK